MAVAELKEALGLLSRKPVLWIPGIVGGILAAILWLTLFVSGAFFSGRLLILFALVLLLFITGIPAAIRSNEFSFRALVRGGAQYYFRVLLPQLVIVFSLLVVFIVCAITFTLFGFGADIGLLVALSFGIMIPTLILTYFFDMAAIFEDRKVFASIQQSILVVSAHMTEVLSYLLVSFFVSAGILFALMIAWEAALFDKLKPIMDFTDAQRQAFTPDQLLAMIGQDGAWITAAVIFIGMTLLVPLLVSYKACFYRKISSLPLNIQQAYGEYDSKGRWYKY